MSETLEVSETEIGLEPVSIFEGSLPVETKLERARTELLDLSARNRLLNIPRSAKSAKTLEVVDERADEIFRQLVGSSRAFTFLAGKSAGGEEPDEEEIAELAQPEEDGIDERGVANRHADTKLQTRLTPAGLQKKLLDLYGDARTLEEEQGVNILFLALGTLKWIDPKDATNIRYAPLVLVPVALDRGNAAEKFKLRWRQEDVAPNLSLEAFLDRVHGLRLPTFEADDAFKPSVYAASVAEAVSAKPGWSVQPDDIVLGFFSFAKFLMYRDLDAANWPAKAKISDQQLIRSLLSEGFDEADDLIADDEPIDPRIDPADMLHIVDSDSSQTLAVHEVRRSKNLVIQGPPGTGKSQTIANIIASAVADGKTVLFVAEKMAALEVVKRRLDATGVGDACLELHSNKANKREVVRELDRTWQLGAPKGEQPDALIRRLTESRDRLNAHVERMHTRHERSQLSPYDVTGQLARLRAGAQKVSDIALPEAAGWSPEDFRQRRALLKELVEQIDDIGTPSKHAWAGVSLGALTPMDRDRLLRPLPGLVDRTHRLIQEMADIAKVLEREAPARLVDFDSAAALADRIAGAPQLAPSALASDLWSDHAQSIDTLIDAIAIYQTRSKALEGLVSSDGWAADVEPYRAILSALPESFSANDFADLRSLAERIPDLIAESGKLAEALGAEKSTTLRGIERLARISERVASAPPASPESFAAELWADGVDRAGDIASAVGRLEDARTHVGDQLAEAAWTLDLAQARATLASHGNGLFRVFSSEWRGAAKLVRSVLANPKLPLGRLLPLLDALARGQSAIREIREGDDFGSKAFGGAWRGERSSSAPLQALVDWMRSLTGLGAEPRLIASRRPDQLALKRLSDAVEPKLVSARGEADRLWAKLDRAGPSFFGAADAGDSGDLEEALPRLQQVVAADDGCREVLTEVPKELTERRRQLTLMVERRNASALVEANCELGSHALDGYWQDLNSDWFKMQEASAWLQANSDIRQLASRVVDRPGVASAANNLLGVREILAADLDAFCDAIKLDRAVAFGGEAVVSAPAGDLSGRLDRWHMEPEALSSWVAYRDRALKASDLNLGEFIERLEQGALATCDALSLFEMSVFEAVINDMVALDPELGRFSVTCP